MLGNYSEQLKYIEIGSSPMPVKDKEKLKILLPKTTLYKFLQAKDNTMQNCL